MKLNEHPDLKWHFALRLQSFGAIHGWLNKVRKTLKLDPIDRQVLRNIEESGWHATAVFPTEDSCPEVVPFVYTVGFGKTWGWPELISFGPDPQITYMFLKLTIDECKKRKVVPRSGLVLHDVMENYTCRLIATSPTQHADHIGSALWFARFQGIDPGKVECLQLLWPDKNGVFPDEEGCSERIRTLQPLLSEDKDFPFATRH